MIEPGDLVVILRDDYSPERVGHVTAVLEVGLWAVSLYEDGSPARGIRDAVRVDLPSTTPDGLGRYAVYSPIDLRKVPPHERGCWSDVERATGWHPRSTAGAEPGPGYVAQ
jgi:hypothetical protein